MLETPTLVQEDLHSHDTGNSLSIGLTALSSLSGYQPIPQAGIHGMVDIGVKRHNIQAVTHSIVGDTSQVAASPTITKSTKTHVRVAVPLPNPQEVKKGFKEIERAFTGGEDLRKLQYRLPTSLAAQPNELEKIYQGMRAGGATHEDALEALRDPDAMRLFLAGHRFNDQLIAIKLPPEEGMEEDFKPSIRDQDTPASQRAFLHLIQDYADFIVQKAKEHPYKAQVIIAGMQAVISGPVSAFISVAKDFILGDKMEEVETKAIEYVSQYLEVPENKVEITENCFKLAFTFFLGGKTKAIVERAEGVVKAVKKLKPKTALNHHQLSEQGKKAVERAQVQQAKKLLPGEGKVGAYGKLNAEGIKKDNLSAHHMPHDSYMRSRGVKKNEGVSMMVEDPYPGTGGRHREIHKILKKQDANKQPRDALAESVKVTRDVYKKDGVYTQEVRQSVKQVIEENKKLYPNLFKKEPK